MGRLEKELQRPDFWNRQEAAQRSLKSHKEVANTLNKLAKFEEELEDLDVLDQLAEEDEELERELALALKRVAGELEEFVLRQTLVGEHDLCNAILSIHPGAGGTESQDWAQMLFRMYGRWVERHPEYQSELLDLQPGEEAGIKSATLLIKGSYAYGFLLSETGVHRLVRISPFDASGRRHTSFASVFVFPELDDDVEVEIDEGDLRVDTYRSSSAGGQHVNVTDSAVRITHLPTGIVVQCQNERSQHKNRSTAMKILRARMYDYLEAERQKEIDKLSGEKTDIAWGHQIRSYVLQPYRLVKDHRTGLEIGNVDSVLDGGIEPLIRAYLTRGQ